MAPEAYLHIISRENAHPAMVFSFKPVFVYFFVDVNNVTFLQSQFSEKETGNIRTTVKKFFQSKFPSRVSSSHSLSLYKPPPVQVNGLMPRLRQIEPFALILSLGPKNVVVVFKLRCCRKYSAGESGCVLGYILHSSSKTVRCGGPGLSFTQADHVA